MRHNSFEPSLSLSLFHTYTHTHLHQVEADGADVGLVFACDRVCDLETQQLLVHSLTAILLLLLQHLYGMRVCMCTRVFASRACVTKKGVLGFRFGV